MSKPTILAVDDDPAVSRAITRDLRLRYGADHRIIPASSGAEALSVLEELTLRDRSVALVASDQRMPEMTGIEMLAEVRRLSPETKLLLRAGHAHAGVLLILALVCQPFVDATDLSGICGHGSHVAGSPCLHC